MAETLMPLDPAEALTSEAAVAVFLEEAFKTADAGYVAHALGVAATARELIQIASV